MITSRVYNTGVTLFVIYQVSVFLDGAEGKTPDLQHISLDFCIGFEGRKLKVMPKVPFLIETATFIFTTNRSANQYDSSI